MTEPKTTYTRAEIREIRETFRDWEWDDRAPEPDSRVTVLYDRRPSELSIGFLCQHEHGWYMVQNVDDLRRFARTTTPGAWRVMMHNLEGDEIFVVPTEQELEMGGFRVTVDPEPGMSDRMFTTTELDALENEFDHRVWRADSEEPDARVTVLYDEADRGVARWLVRVGTGWAWASPHGDPATPDPWDAIQRWMERSGRALRMPDRKELADGGWTITSPEGTEEAATVDEAKEQIDAGFQALEAPGSSHSKAQAHFMASIAISLYELVALHKKYDPESMEIRVEGDAGPDEHQEVLAAADISDKDPGDGFASGPHVNEDFPWAR
jgi:hypothetical protein